jgi:hypothetical protein
MPDYISEADRHLFRSRVEILHPTIDLAKHVWLMCKVFFCVLVLHAVWGGPLKWLFLSWAVLLCIYWVNRIK